MPEEDEGNPITISEGSPVDTDEGTIHEFSTIITCIFGVDFEN